MALKELNREIAAAYGVIAEKVEELLVLINETINETESEEEAVQEKIRLILKSLARFKKSVLGEQEIARRAIRKNEPFLISLEDLLAKIDDLKALIKLAARENKKGRSDKVIRLIDITHKSILTLLNREKTILAKAA